MLIKQRKTFKKVKKNVSKHAFIVIKICEPDEKHDSGLPEVWRWPTPFVDQLLCQPCKGDIIIVMISLRGFREMVKFLRRFCQSVLFVRHICDL